MKTEFSRQISEKFLISNVIQIRSVGVELFGVDGRTDGQIGMTNAIVAFRNFPNAPKMKKGTHHTNAQIILLHSVTLVYHSIE